MVSTQRGVVLVGHGGIPKDCPQELVARLKRLEAQRRAAHTPPSQEEIDAPLYVPESLPADEDLPPVPVCVDTPPETFAEPPATLTSIQDGIFQGSCTFSACHDTQAPAGGLDLASPGLHARLLSHTVLSAQTDLPLIAPGRYSPKP